MREWLVKCRHRAGLTQNAAAKKLKKTTQWYNYLERGERNNDLPLSVILGLMALFGVTFDQLTKFEKAYLRSLKKSKGKEEKENGAKRKESTEAVGV